MILLNRSTDLQDEDPLRFVVQDDHTEAADCCGEKHHRNDITPNIIHPAASWNNHEFERCVNYPDTEPCWLDQ